MKWSMMETIKKYLTNGEYQALVDKAVTLGKNNNYKKADDELKAEEYMEKIKKSGEYEMFIEYDGLEYYLEGKHKYHCYGINENFDDLYIIDKNTGLREDTFIEYFVAPDDII